MAREIKIKYLKPGMMGDATNPSGNDEYNPFNIEFAGKLVLHDLIITVESKNIKEERVLFDSRKDFGVVREGKDYYAIRQRCRNRLLRYIEKCKKYTDKPTWKINTKYIPRDKPSYIFFLDSENSYGLGYIGSLPVTLECLYNTKIIGSIKTKEGKVIRDTSVDPTKLEEIVLKNFKIYGEEFNTNEILYNDIVYGSPDMTYMPVGKWIYSTDSGDLYMEDNNKNLNDIRFQIKRVWYNDYAEWCLINTKNGKTPWSLTVLFDTLFNSLAARYHSSPLPYKKINNPDNSL